MTADLEFCKNGTTVKRLDRSRRNLLKVLNMMFRKSWEAFTPSGSYF